MMTIASTAAPTSPALVDPLQQLKEKFIAEWYDKLVNLLTRVKNYQFPQDCFEIVCFFSGDTERPQRANPEHCPSMPLPIAYTLNLPCWMILRHVAEAKFPYYTPVIMISLDRAMPGQDSPFAFSCRHILLNHRLYIARENKILVLPDLDELSIVLNLFCKEEADYTAAFRNH